MQRAQTDTGKPVALVAARQGTGHDEAAVTSTHAGLPVLDGVSQFLAGVRALFAYRDFQLREPAAPGEADQQVVGRLGMQVPGPLAETVPTRNWFPM